MTESNLHRCKWQSICHWMQRLGPWWVDFFVFHAVAAGQRRTVQDSKQKSEYDLSLSARTWYYCYTFSYVKCKK